MQKERGNSVCDDSPKTKLIQKPKFKGLKLDIVSRKQLPVDFMKKNEANDTKSTESSHSPLPMDDKDGLGTPSFHEKYEILEKLGEGTNGIVYKCLKKDNQQIYAVKQMRCELEHINSLKSSYNYIKMFDHPGIIKYKSMYISKGCETYLVMQHFSHPNLGEVQFKSELEIKNIAYKLFDAIEYMHENGVCHRDIKPENILYDKQSGDIKLIDFGVSREMKTGRFKKQMMTGTGTINYKAPELFRYGFYDELIDEWAAGVTIYRMIAGTTPFESNYISDTIANIEKCVFEFKEGVWSNYSNVVKELMRGLICLREKRICAAQAKNSLWFSGNKQFSQSFHNMKDVKKNMFAEEKSVNFKLNKNKNVKLKNKDVIIRDLKHSDLIFNSSGQCQSDEYEVSDEDEDVKEVNEMFRNKNDHDRQNL